MILTIKTQIESVIKISETDKVRRAIGEIINSEGKKYTFTCSDIGKYTGMDSNKASKILMQLKKQGEIETFSENTQYKRYHLTDGFDKPYKEDRDFTVNEPIVRFFS